MESALAGLVFVQPAGQVVGMGARVGQVVPIAAGQAGQFQVQAVLIEVEIDGVMKGISLGTGAPVRENDVERALVGVKVVPAVEHVASKVAHRKAVLGRDAPGRAPQRAEGGRGIDEPAGAVPVVLLHAAPRRHVLDLAQLVLHVLRRAGLLQHDHVLVLENVISPRQGAVAPQVGTTSLAALVALDVLDDDCLDQEPGALHPLHALKAKRDQLALGIFVADDQYGETARLEQVVAVSGNRLELIEKNVDGGCIGEVGGRVPETDDVVVRWVQDQQLCVRFSPRFERGPHTRRRLGAGAVTLYDTDRLVQQFG